jgi:hypothetical protein
MVFFKVVVVSLVYVVLSRISRQFVLRKKKTTFTKSFSQFRERNRKRACYRNTGVERNSEIRLIFVNLRNFT